MTNTEEGSLPLSSKGGPAESDIELREYRSRKRAIGWRSLLFLAPLAAMLAVRNPWTGVDLLIGGACGVANMLLLMRANERLLNGKGTIGRRKGSGMVRIVSFAAIPVLIASRGPWWIMGVYFGGFFLPLALYALELQRHYRRETL